MATLSGAFGVLAGLLATFGLYGVIAYMVARRRNESGVRMALDAGRVQVMRLVLREALLLLAIGVAVCCSPGGRHRPRRRCSRSSPCSLVTFRPARGRARPDRYAAA
jgi:hypothetical protein